MAKIRNATGTHYDLDGPFDYTHVLDNGPYLSHVHLRRADLSDYHGNLAALGIQIARCRKSGKYDYKHCDRAWAWKRGTATLDELRCPGCGAMLSQTSAAYGQTFWLLPRDAVRVIATDTIYTRRAAAYERLDHALTLPEGYEREYGERFAREEIEKLNKRLAKVQKNPRKREAA
jgi:hypothetical protein